MQFNKPTHLPLLESENANAVGIVKSKTTHAHVCWSDTRSKDYMT